MRVPEVLRLVGNPHPNSLRNWERTAGFPKRFKVGPHFVAFDSHAVARWILARMKAAA